ncbi:MAG: hypothetical protein QME78_15750 [Thermodesulfobacteriota bacterium]|nr:hypothetical protein [Thermodesulfobacteriota bacterium]
MKRLILFVVLGGWLSLLLLPGPALAQGMTLIFGLDETGSYKMRAKGLAVVTAIIRDLKGGDVFYARRITDKSYKDDCSLFRLKVPPTGPAPDNKFDRRAYLEWERKVKQAETAKAQAISILSHLTPVKTPRTDIWGFLAAAADRLKAEDGGAEYKVILASDMQDNVGRRVPVNLMGAEVAVVAFEAGDSPVATQKLQAYWTEALKQCKAQKVIFLPADSQFTLRRQ